MNFPWALCLAREDAASVAALRLFPGIEVAETAREVWLRGERADDPLGAQLFALPATGRFEWQMPDRLRPLHQRIPSLRLPVLNWQPLPAWLQVELPASAWPALEPGAVALRLVRSSDERNPELLMAWMDDFNRFARQAALVRLECLHFAAAANGRVLVRGTPLPPLPGQRFVFHDGVAVPAGFAWQPAVSTAVLARRFGASDQALVLWHEGGGLTRLHTEQFLRATRSAVLATAQAIIGLA